MPRSRCATCRRLPTSPASTISSPNWATVRWDKAAKVLEIDHSTIAPRCPRHPAAGDARLDHDDPGPAGPPGRGAAGERGQGLHAGRARDRSARGRVQAHFGAEVSNEDRNIVFRKRGKGEGTRMWLEYASVTTTENFIISALTANGTSQIVNAACEPHVQEMCAFLEAWARASAARARRWCRSMAAELHGADYTFVEDFHEVATFLALAAVTGGDISVRNSQPENFMLIDRTFAKFGAQVEHKDGWSRLQAPRTGGARELHQPPDHQGGGRALALYPGRPAADLHRAGREGQGPDDVLEQGLRRRADLAHRAVAVRRAYAAVRSAPPDHLSAATGWRRPR
jgi:hypothetical protein